MRRSTRLPLLACLLATSGCLSNLPVNLAGQPAAGDPPAGSAAPADRAAQPGRIETASTNRTTAPAASAGTSTPAAAPDSEPDTVIKLSPGSSRLSSEMEARLASVAKRSREDDRILLRLESYVPDGGSHSLNLVRAEESLQLVKQRLMDLDVSPRRIILAPFGGEYDTARDERRHWVEIYLIRPRL